MKNHSKEEYWSSEEEWQEWQEETEEESGWGEKKSSSIPRGPRGPYKKTQGIKKEPKETTPTQSHSRSSSRRREPEPVDQKPIYSRRPPSELSVSIFNK